MHLRSCLTLVCLLTALPVAAAAAARAPKAPPAPPPPPGPGDHMLAQYFREETARVSAQTFAGVKTLEDWTRLQIGRAHV